MAPLVETSPGAAGIRGRDLASDERRDMPTTSDALAQTCQSQQGQSTPARSADENVREIARKNWNGNRYSTGTLGAAAAPALGRDWRAAPRLTTPYTTPLGVQPLGFTSPSQFNPPCRESAGPADFPGLPGEPPPDESF